MVNFQLFQNLILILFVVTEIFIATLLLVLLASAELLRANIHLASSPASAQYHVQPSLCPIHFPILFLSFSATLASSIPDSLARNTLVSFPIKYNSRLFNIAYKTSAFAKLKVCWDGVGVLNGVVYVFTRALLM